LPCFIIDHHTLGQRGRDGDGDGDEGRGREARVCPMPDRESVRDTAVAVAAAAAAAAAAAGGMVEEAWYDDRSMCMVVMIEHVRQDRPTDHTVDSHPLKTDLA